MNVALVSSRKSAGLLLRTISFGRLFGKAWTELACQGHVYK